jgi:hypothetical protein
MKVVDGLYATKSGPAEVRPGILNAHCQLRRIGKHSLTITGRVARDTRKGMTAVGDHALATTTP